MYNVPYIIKSETITKNDINYIINNQNTYVYIKNNNFNDDFNKLPICVKHLDIYNLETNKDNIIPTHIKWLHVGNFIDKIIIFPTIKILEFYFNNENDNNILNILPYGIESIIIHININNYLIIDLDMLPDSIKSIHFVNISNVNFKIKLNKIYINLQWIYYNKYKVNNHNEVLEYLSKNYENKEILQNNTILLCDNVYNKIMMEE